MDQSPRNQIFRGDLQQKFIERGLAARDEARNTGEYFDADSVYADLRARLTKATARKAPASKA